MSFVSPLLEVRDVVSGYRGMPVLEDVSLTIAEREIVSVVGANGAGKTTLLLTISGHVEASAGRISFGGRDVTRVPAHAHAAGGLVMVPEGGRLFPAMTVLENLELGAYHPAARKRLRDNLDEALAIFPILAERRSQMAGSLSGGERQMCAVARALMSMPRLLMLDEPSLGLAPIMVERLFELIQTLVAVKSIAVLLVEQNVPDALAMCHRGYVLSRGKIARTGTGQALLDDPEIRQAYMGL